MRWNALALAAACSLAIAGCGNAQDARAPAGGVEVDKAFGDKVRAYLLQHPEVIKEAIDQYNANLESQAAAESKVAIQRRRADLERDPRDYVANPNGKVTVVQFYDYRCPHCINVTPKVAAYIAAHPDVRFVFKEMPIFGAPSERAALTALAVKRAGGDYLAVHKEMMAAKPLNEGVLTAILARHGLTPAVLDNPPAADLQQLKDVHDLGSAVGVTGTPSFVIGDTLVVGEDMEAVEAAVATARKAG